MHMKFYLYKTRNIFKSKMKMGNTGLSTWKVMEIAGSLVVFDSVNDLGWKIRQSLGRYWIGPSWWMGYGRISGHWVLLTYLFRFFFCMWLLLIVNTYSSVLYPFSAITNFLHDEYVHNPIEVRGGGDLGPSFLIFYDDVIYLYYLLVSKMGSLTI